MRNKLAVLLVLMFSMTGFGAQENIISTTTSATNISNTAASDEPSLKDLGASDLSVEGERVLLADAGDATTGDVAMCFGFIEAVVATAGAAAAINTAILKVAVAVDMLGAKATATLGALIAAAKLTPVEEAAVRVLMKLAMDKVGKSGSEALMMAGWKTVIAAAKQIYTSCKGIAYTFVSAGSAIISTATQPLACGSTKNHNNWVECQRTCGVSLSAVEQQVLWGIPSTCNAGIIEGLRKRFIWGYGNFCLTSFCGSTPISTRVTKFSQCTLAGGSAWLPAPISEMGKWCRRYDLAKKF